MKKTDIRLYMSNEYADYLKQVATENETTVNDMIMTLIKKKYPMPKKKQQPVSQPQLVNENELKETLEGIQQILDRTTTGDRLPKPAYAFIKTLKTNIENKLNNQESIT